jgi:hypothetical protein
MEKPNSTLTWWPTEEFETVEIEQKIVTKVTYNPKSLKKVSELVRKFGPTELKNATDEDIWERIK